MMDNEHGEKSQQGIVIWWIGGPESMFVRISIWDPI